MTRKLTALLEEEDDGYVALCTQLDIASQGDTSDEALTNLKEAVDLFLETASEEEITQRFRRKRVIAEFEVACG